MARTQRLRQIPVAGIVNLDACHLTLVVPELFWAIQGEYQPHTKKTIKLPAALKKLLARSWHRPAAEKDYDSRLFELFNIQTGNQHDIPLAVVICSLEKPVSPNRYYLFADPVHLRADRDSIIMLDNKMLDIKAEEADQLIGLINSHFDADGIRIEPVAGQHWCLSMPDVQKIHTFSLNDVIGQNIRNYLPYGEDSKYWRSIFNEMQMLLSKSDVNREREARGDVTINSLWFWGGGVMPADVKSPWSTVCGNNELIQGLAKVVGMRCEKTPEGAADWYKLAGEGEHLVVIDAARGSRQKSDIDAWHQMMIQMEKMWFSPLLDMLKSKQLSSLTAYPNTTSSYHITSELARRWWKGIFNHKLPPMKPS